MSGGASTASKKAISLLDRFRGCMVGAVVGDCLGAPVECQFWDGIPAEKVVEYFTEYIKDSEAEAAAEQKFRYTDDTAMARQVADSIISMRSVDTKDLAQRFVGELRVQTFRSFLK
jgi:poly(ADP-ribose) glycohydrolase ARH3